MSWIEKKEWFKTTAKERNGKPEMTYTISEVAALMKVSRQTVWKWLSISDPQGAVIPMAGWFKTPGGDVRIRESAVLLLQKQTQ